MKNNEVDKGNDRPAVPAADVGVGPLPRKLMLSTTTEKRCGTLYVIRIQFDAIEATVDGYERATQSLIQLQLKA